MFCVLYLYNINNIQVTTEVFYANYNEFPEIVYRLYCSNMHYNENATRKQAKTRDRALRWAVTYPKAFQGEKAIAKPLKEKPTYGKNR
jgi:hypothetical protein